MKHAGKKFSFIFKAILIATFCIVSSADEMKGGIKKNELKGSDDEYTFEAKSASAKSIFPYSMDFKPRRVFLENKMKAIVLYWNGLYAPKTVDKMLNRIRNRETKDWENLNKPRLPFESEDYLKKEADNEKLFLPPLEYQDFQAESKGVWKQLEDEKYAETIEDAKKADNRFYLLPRKDLLKNRSKQILKFWKSADLVPPEEKYDILREKYEEQINERRDAGLEVSDDREEERNKLTDESLFSDEESARSQRKKEIKMQTQKNFHALPMKNLMDLYTERLQRNWVKNSLGDK